MTMLHHRTTVFQFLFFALSFYAHTVHSLGVDITYPPGGATISANQDIDFKWQDGGGSPDMAQLASYTLELIVGGNSLSNSKVLQTIGANGHVADGSVTDAIAADVAQSIQNGFYLKMTSNTTTGNQVINYSDRFTIVNMKGSVDPQFLQAANAAAGDESNVPNAQYNVLSQPTSSTSSPPSATATVTQTSVSNTATSTPTDTPDDSDSDDGIGLSGGVIAGIVTVTVLALIGIISIIVWAAFLYRRVKRKRESGASGGDKDVEEHGMTVFVDDKAELPGRPLSTSRSPRELHSTSSHPNLRHEVSGDSPPVEIGEREPSIYELEASGPFHELADRSSKQYTPL